MPQRSQMTRWYSPAQLAKTAPEVASSTLFGNYADPRLIEALFNSAVSIYDFSQPGKVPTDSDGALWIDYVADTGDGWNSTYAVAYAVAQAQLTLASPTGLSHRTERGGVLVFGGDEIYPTASRQAYTDQLVAPYATAMRHSTAPHPAVFAIPGNHDWYDGLISFSRLFMGRSWFAGWQCVQERSYFAVKLPHGWWLLGTDMQLGSDIDRPQVEYFQKVARQMQPDDQIIICNAEPDWIYAAMYGAPGAAVYNEGNFAFLESDKVLGRKIDITIAGDLHHYRRHEATDAGGHRREKITAGGGGAFLHPTHQADVSRIAGGFELQASFPSPAESARLCWGNLLFLKKNFSFGLLPAALYLLLAWSVRAEVGQLGPGEFLEALRRTITATMLSPVASLICVMLFGGFFLFTDTHSKAYRMIGGSVHGVCHLFAVFLLGWWSATLVYRVGLDLFHPSGLLLSAGLIFAGGWIVGSVLMGLYLLISLNVFGRHHNEAFSSLANEDWKNFVRFKVEAGQLTIYPVGLRRVPRRWKASHGKSGPELEPDDASATAPELIEEPIVIKRKVRPPAAARTTVTQGSP